MAYRIVGNGVLVPGSPSPCDEAAPGTPPLPGRGITLTERSRSRSSSCDRLCTISVRPIDYLDVSLRDAAHIFRKRGHVEGVFTENDTLVVTFSEPHCAREAVRKFHKGRLNGKIVDVSMEGADEMEKVFTYVLVRKLSSEIVDCSRKFERPLFAKSLAAQISPLLGRHRREIKFIYQETTLAGEDIIAWGCASRPTELAVVFQDLPKDRRKVFVKKLPHDIRRAELESVFGTYGRVLGIGITKEGDPELNETNNMSASIQYATLIGAENSVLTLNGVYSIRTGFPSIEVSRSPLPPPRLLAGVELPQDNRFALFKNLPDGVSDGMLEAVCSQYGSVFNVELGIEGRALVGFRNAAQVALAIACLHGVYRFDPADAQPILVLQCPEKGEIS